LNSKIIKKVQFFRIKAARAKNNGAKKGVLFVNTPGNL
jgi:hypothetical protein